MTAELGDLAAFVTVARRGGFREAAREGGMSASALSQAVRRLEARLGLRLFNRTTRSVTLTEAGARLLERLLPALGEVEAALDTVNAFRATPSGTLRLNVPTIVARFVLPPLAERFLLACPEITLEVTAEDSFVDVLAAGCDAGVRYDERLEQDMIAVPIGPRVQRYVLAASPAYLERAGRPERPEDLLAHACIRLRFASGAMTPWEFEQDGRTFRVEPKGRFVVSAPAADAAVRAAVAGLGIVCLFEEWVRPDLEAGRLAPVMEPWWQSFPGPRLYYPGRRYVPAPLRAFLDFLRVHDMEAIGRERGTS